MLTSDFWMGLLMGFALAGLAGWFVSLYRNWLKARDAYKKPQTVIHTTSKTPEQVGKEADAAGFKILLLNISIFMVAWLSIELFLPEVAQLVRVIFRRLMDALIS